MVKQLDLADLASVQRLVEELLREPRLDMLILNAGIMGGPLAYTSAGFELQMGTNHMGAHLRLDFGPPSDVKLLGSCVQSTHRNTWNTLCATKPTRYEI